MKIINLLEQLHHCEVKFFEIRENGKKIYDDYIGNSMFDYYCGNTSVYESTNDIIEEYEKGMKLLKLNFIYFRIENFGQRAIIFINRKEGEKMFEKCKMFFENKKGECLTDCDNFNCRKNKLFLFNEGVEVFLWTDKWQLDGIHNHDTKENLIDTFGEDIIYNKCFKNSVKGIIKKVGKNNMYAIESFTGEVFIYNNNYNEMWKVVK